MKNNILKITAFLLTSSIIQNAYATIIDFDVMSGGILTITTNDATQCSD